MQLLKTIFILVLTLLASTSYARDCVVLIHGMNRTPFSMRAISAYLSKHGYDVVNKHYPSNTLSTDQVSKKYVNNFVRDCRAKSPKHIHVVTHSMGGVLIRYFLKNHRLPQGSRIVMLSPPNHGSEMADRLQNSAIYQASMGPMGQELRTGDKGITKQLPEYLPYDIGIITGNFNMNATSIGAFKTNSDGKVSVTSARLKGMKDFLVVNATHTFITIRPDVVYQIGYFLENGQFKKGH